MDIYQIYHANIPDFIKELSDAPEMQRLKGIGMDCGCEYTKFPAYQNLTPYSRFDHSIGVALIVWHFTNNITQSIAGLFHDISSPTFSHTVDFMHKDYTKQESTENGTEEIINSSTYIQSKLQKYGIRTEEVCDYHIYPIADNDKPKLSADRLEYTLNNMIRYLHKPQNEVKSFYDDLFVSKNESGIDELVFKTEKIAEQFSILALETCKIYVLDEDRFSMESLAILMRDALQRGVLSMPDLNTTEPEIIAKIKNDQKLRQKWNWFCSLHIIQKSYEKPPKEEEEEWINITAKKRYIDPIVFPLKRVSAISPPFQAALEDFKKKSFDYWVKGI